MKKLLWILGLLVLLSSCNSESETVSEKKTATSLSEPLASSTAEAVASSVAETDSRSEAPLPMEYDTYFSMEREFVRDETAAEDAHFACSLEEERLTVKEMKTGAVFHPVDERVRTFWRFGDVLYINGYETGIVKYELDERTSEVLYADSDFDSLYLNADVAFFVKNGTSGRFYPNFNPDTAFAVEDSAVHRFHIPTRTDEVVYQASGIAKCEPKSNRSIQVTIDNPDYVQYLKETGDLNNNTNLPEYVSFLYDIAKKTLIPYDPRMEDPNFWGNKEG